jgi:tetratricopeptide (TPR) repeat protein
MARVHLRSGRHTAALQDIEQALALCRKIHADDLTSEYLFLRGELLLDRPAPDEAVEDFRQALALAENNKQYLLAYRCRLHLAGLGTADIETAVAGLVDLLSQAKTLPERAYAGYHLCLSEGSGKHRKRTMDTLKELYHQTPLYQYGQMLEKLSALPG